MPEKTNYEKYLAGEPLSEELRALREGRESPFRYEMDFPAATAPAGPENRPLNRSERELLKEAKASGVLAIIEQTLKRTLQTHIQSATMDSENDPLGHADEISRQWAYVAMYRRATMEFRQLIDAEIAELDGDARLLDGHQAERTTG